MEPFDADKTSYTASRSNPMPSIQHNIPLSLGGLHEIENISVVCQSCNFKTNNKPTGSLNNAKVKELWLQIQAQSATSRQPVAPPMQYKAIQSNTSQSAPEPTGSAQDFKKLGTLNKKSYAKAVRADEALAAKERQARTRPPTGPTQSVEELFGGKH